MRCDRLLVGANQPPGSPRTPPDRDIVRLFGRGVTSPKLSVSATVRWDIHKLVAQSRM